ncbi:MAG: hypothetical protein Kow00121_18320 [Elainellaceae cyanobacterium]
MHSTPLVSAIIIFLNGEEYIEEAIASIFSQTYPHWELLLVDDGSTDGSTAIAQRYAQQYPDQVRYLEHEGHQNRGMSAARNLGIRHAQGEYIGFLDADDIWLPQKLEQQVAILQTHPEAAMVYGRTQIWYSWTGQEADRDRDHFYELGVQPNTLIKPPTLFQLLLQNKYQTPTTCNALIRRDVFNAIGQFEEAFRTMYEDQVFFAKVTLKAPVFVGNECWAKYRQHPQSCSSDVERMNYYKTRQPFLMWLENYLVEQNIQDQAILQALRWEVWQVRHPVWSNLIQRVQYYQARIQALFSNFR